MALVLPFGDAVPRIGQGVFLAPNATLIGDIEIGDEASVWFGAVLRADIGRIRIGPRTNVQDLACIHMTDGISNAIVGADVTVGHGAILHGCIVEDRCLIGMGSIILDNARIGAGSVIAAGSVVTARTEIPPRSLVRGTPAKVIREVTDEEAKLGINGAQHYLAGARRFRAILASAGALSKTGVLGVSEPLDQAGRSSLIAAAPPLRVVPREEDEFKKRQKAIDFGNDREQGED
jgi:carbonic anhydrase/acetyltransferase-like protein (isoleucine patch superfamily)